MLIDPNDDDAVVVALVGLVALAVMVIVALATGSS